MTKQDEFRRRHSGWQHKPVPWGPQQDDRLLSAWRTVLESQNGHDVDESQPGAMTRFLQALGSMLPAPGRMLVVGCGTGEEVLEARALGWQADGITLAPMNQAWCAEQHGLDVRFEDFHFSSFQTGSFDTIVGRQVWEHSWAPLHFALECSRLLRPGGTVVLETPDCARFIGDRWDLHHVFCPTPFQGVSLLEKAGFTGVKALDYSTGSLVPFADEHRDDVGGPHVVCIGRRWTKADEHLVNPIVREFTSRGA
jgi:SAM-dependent methyltransferase